MFLMQTVGETGKKTDGMANVKMAHYAGKDKFTKNISVGETFLSNNFLCFGRLLRWTLESHQVLSNSWLDGNRHGTVVFAQVNALRL